MSKNSLKKIIINRHNPDKVLLNKKDILNKFQIGNYNIINEKRKKNIINYKNIKNVLNYNIENKENYSIQYSKTNENNKLNDINLYLIKPNQKITNLCKNQSKINLYKKLNNSKNHNNKQENKILINSKILENKENINDINFLYNKINITKNNEGFFTKREKVYNNINKENDIKIKEYKIINTKPLTERENNKIFNSYFKKNYLLPENKTNKKTLILDLDETLIHSSLKPFNIKNEIIIKINKKNNSDKTSDNNIYIIHILKRPYISLFLSIVCDIFEVVVFTASISDYANSILDEIDTEKKIKYRLFREHCIKIDKNKYIKNLYCLGRDLKNVIIIDNNPLSYALNTENGLPISSWETNPNDNELIKLIPLLQYLSKDNIYDVKPIIKKIVKNNEINYDEINKLIISSNSKSNNLTKINNCNDIKIKNKVKYIKNTLDQKLESMINNIKSSNLNNPIPKEKIVKNIFINKDNDLFIKTLNIINKTNYRGKSENKKSTNFNFEKYMQKDNDIIKKRNNNLSERYLVIKTNKNDSNTQRSIKTDINNYVDKNKSKLKMSKSFLGNNKKVINISLSNNYSYIIPTNKKSLKTKNILHSKINNKFNTNKVGNKKDLIKNNSDYNFSLTRNIQNEPYSNYRNVFKSPKNLFYTRIFQKKIKYENKANTNFSINSITNLLNTNKNIMKDNANYNYFDFKRINHIKELKENKNYSVNNYLNNKFNFNGLDNKSNSFVINLYTKN